MAFLKWLVIIIVTLVVLVVLAGQVGLLRGKPPQDLGVTQGKLKHPSTAPNSVSSQADLWPDNPQRIYSRIPPLELVGDGAATMARIAAVLREMPRTELVTVRDDYIYAVFTTSLLKFADDVEFWLDDAEGVVQVRSSSRLGRKDLGVNRARVEAIRLRLQAPV